MRRWILDAANTNTPRIRQSCLEAIAKAEIKENEPLVVTLGPFSPPRSLAQNRFYWDQIVTPIGNTLGYEKQEMHELLLMFHFGSKEIVYTDPETGQKQVFSRPLKRSSELKKKEMHEYLEWCPRFAAEQGVVLDV